MNPAPSLSGLMSALADPTRRAILMRLALGEAGVNELAAPHAMSLPAISKHIKVLQNAGLITRSRHAQQRPCRLEPDALKAVEDWLGACRALAENRVDAYLDDLRKWEGDLAGRC